MAKKTTLKEPAEDKEDEEKTKLKSEDMDDDEKVEKEDEGKCKECGELKANCKCAKKGELGGENPQEDTASATDANSSISPGMGVPSTQNVFVPASNISTGRNAVGSGSPSEVSYAGKSANPDLMKSPLFVELSKQISAMEGALGKKFDSVEKSFNDRIANMQKTLAAVESFYKNAPLYKSISEPAVAPQVEKSFNEKLASKAQYSL